MTTEFDAYGSIYDLTMGRLTEDIPFYVALAEEAEPPVLELAVGTGRVLVPVAQAGVPVWGIDSAREMLRQAEKKVEALPAEVRSRVHLSVGDMRDFELDQKFGLIYVPARAFLHLMTVEDQLIALRNVRRHLRPGGRLALNFFTPSLPFIVDRMGSTGPALVRLPRGDYVDPETGNQVRVWHSGDLDPFEQSIDEVRVYEEIDDGGEVVKRVHRTLTLRWMYRYEMEHLLARTGFAVEALYGDFDRRPYESSDDEMIWVARKTTGG